MHVPLYSHFGRSSYFLSRATLAYVCIWLLPVYCHFGPTPPVRLAASCIHPSGQYTFPGVHRLLVYTHLASTLFLAFTDFLYTPIWSVHFSWRSPTSCIHPSGQYTFPGVHRLPVYTHLVSTLFLAFTDFLYTTTLACLTCSWLLAVYSHFGLSNL